MNEYLFMICMCIAYRLDGHLNMSTKNENL